MHPINVCVQEKIDEFINKQIMKSKIEITQQKMYEIG